MSKKEVRLDSLKSGVAEVLQLNTQAAKRLKALGIFEGQQIELTKAGNPMIVRAAGGAVALAREVASDIVVRTA